MSEVQVRNRRAAAEAAAAADAADGADRTAGAAERLERHRVGASCVWIKGDQAPQLCIAKTFPWRRLARLPALVFVFGLAFPRCALLESILCYARS